MNGNTLETTYKENFRLLQSVSCAATVRQHQQSYGRLQCHVCRVSMQRLQLSRASPRWRHSQAKHRRKVTRQSSQCQARRRCEQTNSAGSDGDVSKAQAASTRLDLRLQSFKLWMDGERGRAL